MAELIPEPALSRQPSASAFMLCGCPIEGSFGRRLYVMSLTLQCFSPTPCFGQCPSVSISHWDLFLSSSTRKLALGLLFTLSSLCSSLLWIVVASCYSNSWVVLPLPILLLSFSTHFAINFFHYIPCCKYPECFKFCWLEPWLIYSER